MGKAMSYVYFVIAVFLYGVSQTITFGKFRLKGDFWQNWSRKYKHPLELAPSTWYYKLAVLKYKEKFAGSGTVFTFLNDGYHFTQMVFKVSLSMAIVTYKPWLGVGDALLYLVLWGIVHTATNRFVSA